MPLSGTSRVSLPYQEYVASAPALNGLGPSAESKCPERPPVRLPSLGEVAGRDAEHPTQAAREQRPLSGLVRRRRGRRGGLAGALLGDGSLWGEQERYERCEQRERSHAHLAWAARGTCSRKTLCRACTNRDWTASR